MAKEKLSKTIIVRVTEEEYEYFDQFKNKSAEARKIIKRYLNKLKDVG